MSEENLGLKIENAESPNENFFKWKKKELF